MSGECEKFRFRKLNMNEPIPLSDGIDPPAELPPIKLINVNGREEHEALLKDADKCKELGLDQMYEIMVYLKRWGDWLKEGDLKQECQNDEIKNEKQMRKVRTRR